MCVLFPLALSAAGTSSCTAQSIVDQMVIYAPVASQVYQRNVELGEYVSPGVPLVTLVDLSDVWIHFDLREDLVKTLKIGDRFGVRIPALSDRRILVEVKVIAAKGEYSSWRATRTTGDFDLRTFSIRAWRQGPGAASRNERLFGLAGARMRAAKSALPSGYAIGYSFVPDPRLSNAL